MIRNYGKIFLLDLVNFVWVLFEYMSWVFIVIEDELNIFLYSGRSIVSICF